MKQLFRPVYEVDACLARIKTVLETGWTGTGPQCAQFENDFADYIGNDKTNCVFLSSCTAALQIAVRLCCLNKGDTIVSTPITFVSTNNVILHEGMNLKFCDVDPDTLTLDPDKLMAMLDKDYSIKAVMWVHYSGNVHPRFMEVVNWCKEKNIQIIEDCAHAMGAYYPGTKQKVGSLTSTIACFSFQAVKNLPTFDSGMIVCREGEAERTRQLSWLGIDKSTYARTGSTDLYKWKYECVENGFKCNGNDIAAAIAIEQLKVLDRDNTYRKMIYNNYFSTLNGKVKVFKHEDKSSNHFVEIAVNNREEIMSKLKDVGYATGVHYMPNYEFSVYAKYYNGECPTCEVVSKQIMTLPTHLQITIEDIEIICNVILQNIK